MAAALAVIGCGRGQCPPGFVPLSPPGPALKYKEPAAPALQVWGGSVLETRDPDTARRLDDQFARELAIFQEPPLWDRATKEPELVAYRFVRSPCFPDKFVRSCKGGRIVARLERRGNAAPTLIIKHTSACGADDAEMVKTTTTSISEADWKRTAACINDAGFWTLPESMSAPEYKNYDCFFEGLETGHHRVVLRSNLCTPTLTPVQGCWDDILALGGLRRVRSE